MGLLLIQKWASLLIAFNRAKGAPSVFSFGCPFFSLEDAENDPKGHPLEEERRREERYNGLRFKWEEQRKE